MTHLLEQMTRQILAFRSARRWEQFHNPKDMALSLMLEAGEVAEHFQWKDLDEAQQHIAAHREEIAEELADVLYWVLLMSHDLKVDLPAAFAAKMHKNDAKYPVERAMNSHRKYSEL